MPVSLGVDVLFALVISLSSSPQNATVSRTFPDASQSTSLRFAFSFSAQLPPPTFVDRTRSRIRGTTAIPNRTAEAYFSPKASASSFPGEDLPLELLENGLQPTKEKSTGATRTAPFFADFPVPFVSLFKATFL